MGEEALKLQARLGAIEFAICELTSMCYHLGGWTNAQVKARHDHWIALAQKSFAREGLDPAQTALLSGELEDALAALSGMIRAHLGTLLQRNG
jgi:hypothetical protein